MATTPNEWENYWQGRSDFGTDLPQSRAHRFVGEDYDAPLDAFWNDVFSDLPRDTRVLDLACGSGAILKYAHTLGFSHLTGIDRSPDAIALLSETPGITGVAAPLDDMPFEAASFDLITSQYGFEYAGAQSLTAVIADLLAPGGQFVALVHMSEGTMAEGCAKTRDEALAFDVIGFIPVAKAFFTELSKLENGQGSQAAFQAAMAAQAGPQQKMTALGHAGHPLAQHVIKGASWLFENRAKHPLQYTLDWLSLIDSQNKAHMARMSGMLSAALSASDVEAFCQALADQGLQAEPATRFKPFEDKPAAAWVLKASKPRQSEL